MKRWILVVDDEVDMLQLLKRSLAADLDCTVETASSGETALKRVAKGHWIWCWRTSACLAWMDWSCSN